MSEPLSPEEFAKATEAKRIQDAQEQATEYGGFAIGTYTAPNGETFPVYNLNSLDDDQQTAFDAVQFLFNTCDRHEDQEMPGYTVKDKDGTERKFDGWSQPGGYKIPYQKDGVLLSPPARQQFTRALLGDKDFERFQKAKGRSSDYFAQVEKLAVETKERAASDPKSGSGAEDDSAVPDAD